MIPLPTSQVFVSEYRNHRISVFTLEGQLLRAFGKAGNGDGEPRHPKGICLNPQGTELFVADCLSSQVQVLSPDGIFLRAWGAGQLLVSRDVKVSALEVFVSDLGNHRVCVFRPDGTLLRVLGKGEGDGDGQLRIPTGLALTAHRTVLVCDESNHRVQELRASDGAFVRKWGKHGHGEGELKHPCGVAVSDKGEVFVCDSNHHKVQVFV